MSSFRATAPFYSPASIRNKAPIINPYERFSRTEFDGWIEDITGHLQRALGHQQLSIPRAITPLPIPAAEVVVGNPFEIFTQTQFDAWIREITTYTRLREAREHHGQSNPEDDAVASEATKFCRQEVNAPLDMLSGGEVPRSLETGRVPTKTDGDYWPSLYFQNPESTEVHLVPSSLSFRLKTVSQTDLI